MARRQVSAHGMFAPGVRVALADRYRVFDKAFHIWEPGVTGGCGFCAGIARFESRETVRVAGATLYGALFSDRERGPDRWRVLLEDSGAVYAVDGTDHIARVDEPDET